MQNTEVIPRTSLSSLVDGFDVNFWKFCYGRQFLFVFDAFLSAELANEKGLFSVELHIWNVTVSCIDNIYCGRYCQSKLLCVSFSQSIRNTNWPTSPHYQFKGHFQGCLMCCFICYLPSFALNCLTLRITWYICWSNSMDPFPAELCPFVRNYAIINVW